MTWPDWMADLHAAMASEQEKERRSLDEFWSGVWAMYGTYHLIEPDPHTLEDA